MRHYRILALAYGLDQYTIENGIRGHEIHFVETLQDAEAHMYSASSQGTPYDMMVVRGNNFPVCYTSDTKGFATPVHRKDWREFIAKALSQHNKNALFLEYGSGEFKEFISGPAREKAA